MRKFVARGCGYSIVLAAVFLLCFVAAFAQSAGMKTLTGRVIDAADAPLSSAVVYLQDSKTNNIRSFISAKDGAYRFGQISADTDYTVWAELQGKKSGTKSISSFDSKKQLVLDLKIKTDK
jgi:hypothetical protein